MKKINSRTLKILIAFTLLIKSLSGLSTPWIGIDNYSLHSDLKVLVNLGYIESPTMTFPIPWHLVHDQIQNLVITNVDSAAYLSLARIKRYLKLRNKFRSKVNVIAANEPLRFQSFNSEQGTEERISFSNKFENSSWAGKLSLNSDDGEFHVDGSYLAYRTGNWQFGVHSIKQWWGPGEVNSLILSNNARPVPSLFASHSKRLVENDSWYSFIDYWHVNMQLGEMESERTIPNAKLWRARLNVGIFNNFELGFAWSAMWGGDGLGNSLRDFWDVITFAAICNEFSEVTGQYEETGCDEDFQSKKGNHLAGIDLSYKTLINEVPFNFYVQTIGEDAKNYYMVVDKAYLAGLSTIIGQNRYYFEYSDTVVSCNGEDPNLKDCFYEHGVYVGGYRIYDRSIGSIYDSDSESYSLGFSKAFIDGDKLDLRVDFLELNSDGTKPSPALNGNTEDVYGVYGSYLLDYENHKVRFDVSLESSSIDDRERETESYFLINYEYNF